MLIGALKLLLRGYRATIWFQPVGANLVFIEIPRKSQEAVGSGC